MKNRRMISLPSGFVEVIYSSQHKIILKLENGKRVEITPFISETAYDDPAAFLEYKERPEVES